LAICICKTLLLHRPDDFIDFTLNCPLHILQQNVPMAAGKWEHTQNKKTNLVNWTRNCTNSVVALQDQCSYKAPTTNHHMKKIVNFKLFSYCLTHMRNIRGLLLLDQISLW